MLYMNLLPEVECIHVSVTTLQKLVEALQGYAKVEVEILEIGRASCRERVSPRV